jgi:antitoxin component YwqK of YwqJK toxin-antitoxin module
MLPCFVMLAAFLRVVAASAQDDVVKALIARLSDADSDIRANTARNLRKLLASDEGARTNNRGRLYWEARLNQVKPGMTDDEVKRLLPPADASASGVGTWSGGTGNRQWRLDDYWMVVVHYYYPDSVHETPPSLRRHAREVKVDLPANFTGTCTTYYVNGQKAFEMEYKNGKYGGSFTAFHDNGRKSVEQHYVDGTCSGADRGWYVDGAPAYEGNYVNGKQDGMWTHWSEDGRLRSRYNFRAGKYQGTHIAWHENGQKQHECTYQNGEKQGPDNAWNADGELLWSRNYENGELVE